MRSRPHRLLSARVLPLLPQRLPGKARLGRLLLGSHLRPGECEISSCDGHVFSLPDAREPIAFELCIHGGYELDTLAMIKALLPEAGTFVDVGANVGVFAVPAGLHVGPKGRVLAIEASPTVYPYLERNLEQNNVAWAIAINCALQDRDDVELPFWDAPADRFGMGALAPQFHSAPTQVAARTLDILLAERHINHVDVLKVDVEGFEAAVFRGATKLLTGPLPPVVIFEFADWAELRSGEAVGAAQRLLLRYGYKLSVLIKEKTEVEVLQPLVHGFKLMVARR